MTLTEQWKKGELESGYYYIVVKQVEFPNRIDFYNSSPKVWSYHSNDVVKEVLAPVPSYEEWQKLIDTNDTIFRQIKDINSENYELEKQNKQLRKFLEEFNALDVVKENKQLKAQIAKLTEIVGVLPSNHSVGNLGYKIKNQRHEINNRLKEIDKLKELLKECKANLIHKKQLLEKLDKLEKPTKELLSKIDNAIGVDNDKK